MLQRSSAKWRFPSVLIAVTEMRRRLRGFLNKRTALSFDETEDLLLAASEAANNAVEHAQRPTEPFFDVSSDVDDEQVTVVVQDHGGWRQPTSPSDRGRGLAMIRALADTTVETLSHGTTVTMRSRYTGPGTLTEKGRPLWAAPWIHRTMDRPVAPDTDKQRGKSAWAV